MEVPKTKAISRIEGRMEKLDEQSLRFETLRAARQFKMSWIELGQYLQTVWKEKQYKGWGYLSFESYCSKELALKHTTALKLLRSYYFLEREEPSFLKTQLHGSGKVVAFPSVDSVDILRLAKDKKGLEGEDYKTLRYRVLDKGEEPGEVRSKLRSILHSHAGISPEDEQRKRDMATVTRFVSTLRGLKKALELSSLISRERIREIDRLIANIEEEIPG